VIAALLSACAACGPSERVVEPPEGVTQLAVGRRAGGQWLDVTALSPRRGPLRVSVRAEDDVIVLGWSDEALEQAFGGLPPPEVLGTSPLRGVVGCQRPLPPSTWAVRATDGAADALDPASLPPLTASWALERCEPLAPSASVTCGDSLLVCPLRAVSPEAGCRRTLDFECELGRVDLAVWPGGACSETPGCQATRGADGTISLTCVATCVPGDASCQSMPGERSVSCTASLEPTSRFHPELTRVRVGAGGTQVPPQHERYEVWPSAVGSGQLGSPVVVMDDAGTARLVVPAFAWREPGCTDRQETELVFVSAQTATIVARRPAPGCLTLLAADPRGAGFLGFAHEGGVPVVHRFDAHGVVLRSARLTTLPQVRAEVALASYTDGLVVLAYASTTEDGGAIAVLDPDTLEVRATLVHAKMVPSFVTRIDEWIVVVDDFNDLAVWFDPSLTQCAGSTTAHLLLAPIMDLGNLPLLAAAYVGQPRQLLMAVSEYPALHRADDLCSGAPTSAELCFAGEGRCTAGRRVVTLDAGAEPLRMLAWPALEGRGLAVASTVRPRSQTWTFEAALTYYDPRSGRFWPGLTRLGHGVARDLVVAPDGALWVSLPWAGELVRLDRP
jgi:hypothetical protein